MRALRPEPAKRNNPARPVLRACLSLASKGECPQRAPSASQASMTDTSLPAIPETKARRISRRLQEAIRLLSEPECKTQKAAADKLGMSPTYLCEALKKPEVRVFIERAARETIANGTLRAANRVMDLVHAGSEHVSLDASKHVLAVAGIKPSAEAQVSVNIDIKAGYVIDLSDSPKPRNDARLTHGPLLDQDMLTISKE